MHKERVYRKSPSGRKCYKSQRLSRESSLRSQPKVGPGILGWDQNINLSFFILPVISSTTASSWSILSASKVMEKRM